MMGLGLVRGIDEMQRLVRVEREYAPDAGRHACYERLFDFYMRMYWHLQSQFSEIASIQRGEEPTKGERPA
jgi:sugar (pentulose or hexulose) kinase